MVSEERAEQAIRYLAETDLECARRQTLYDGLLRMKHEVLGVEFTANSGGVAEREALSYASKAYKDLREKTDAAQLDFMVMRNKRDTERLVWEHWRSVNANRRQGQ